MVIRQKDKYTVSSVAAELKQLLKEDIPQEFKDWAVSWFFYAFGTWGLSYNFGNELDAIFSEEIQEYFDRKDAEENGVEYDPTCKQLELTL